MRLAKRISITLISILLCSISSLAKEQSDAENQDVQTLIAELRTHPWPSPYAATIPLRWDFQFTEPMRKILAIGPPAQAALLENLKDEAIKDQIIILLGGLGDERAVGPIIEAMIAEKSLKSTPRAEQINLSANIALTNITVADVIWHYGGGVVEIDPPKDSQKRWAKWWKKNKAIFTVKGITHDRHYSNYPDYGIYKQP